jgi:hypothetical protein
MLKVVMARGRKLKKVGDLEVHKENVVSSKHTIGKQNVDPLQLGFGEQNVAPLELRLGEQNGSPLKLKPEEQNVASKKLKIDESSNLCGLELIMVTICNSNDEITLNTDLDFNRKMVGYIVSEFTYIRLNADKKIVQVFLSLILSTTSII